MMHFFNFAMYFVFTVHIGALTKQFSILLSQTGSSEIKWDMQMVEHVLVKVNCCLFCLSFRNIGVFVVFFYKRIRFNSCRRE